MDILIGISLKKYIILIRHRTKIPNQGKAITF